MPLRQSAREMRDLYANEIARDVHGGRTPSEFSLEAWARYAAELAAYEAAVPAPVGPAAVEPATVGTTPVHEAPRA